MKRIIFTVTNDLTYDQRMHRICGSLAGAGYEVCLVGRKLKDSKNLVEKSFSQKRLSCFINKGFLFYLEYNLRLFFYLLTQKTDAICAIDLDTILPCLLVSKLKKTKRVYDAHEYFTELKEVRTRKWVRWIWLKVEAFAVPQFKNGYTVSKGLADAFYDKYGRSYELIRNMPVLKSYIKKQRSSKQLYYQGAVNEARGFEFLIPAMKNIPYKLVICGDGNFMQQLKMLIKENDVEDKIELLGMRPPEELQLYAAQATLGMGLAESEGLNQYMALPNKFFDYMHEGLPQVAMNYPEYIRINNEFKVAVLLDNLDPDTISQTINRIMQDDALLKNMQENCLKAREIYNWSSEEKKLLTFYNNLFNE